MIQHDELKREMTMSNLWAQVRMLWFHYPCFDCGARGLCDHREAEVGMAILARERLRTIRYLDRVKCLDAERSEGAVARRVPQPVSKPRKEAGR